MEVGGDGTAAARLLAGIVVLVFVPSPGRVAGAVILVGVFVVGARAAPIALVALTAALLVS
jgi:hypothetical protein